MSNKPVLGCAAAGGVATGVFGTLVAMRLLNGLGVTHPEMSNAKKNVIAAATGSAVTVAGIAVGVGLGTLMSHLFGDDSSDSE